MKLRVLKCSESICSEAVAMNTTGTMAKIKAPIFKGEAHEKPLQFLSDLEKYINAYKNSNESNIAALISQCLIKNAKNLFYLVQREITSYEKFQEIFKKRYCPTVALIIERVKIDALVDTGSQVTVTSEK